MYARLKQIMRDKGYTVTEGDVWNSADTNQFQVFSRLVLGVPITHPNHALAYPESCPQLMALIQNAPGNEAAPVTQSIPVPAAAPVEPPVAEQPASEDAADADPNVMDVGGGSTEPDVQPSDEDDTPPSDEEGEGDEPAEDKPADEETEGGDAAGESDEPADENV